MSSRQIVNGRNARVLADSQADGNVTSVHPAPGSQQVVLLFQTLLSHFVSGWKWIERKRIQQLTNRRISVAETVSLGEKRFVSILQVDGTQFLIAGAAETISLLAVLNKEEGAATMSWQRPASTVEQAP